MKGLKKTLAVVTAIAAMLAAIPAFAEVNVSVVEPSSGLTVTPANIETASPQITAAIAGSVEGEMTFLILDDEADVTAIEEADILYINQQNSSESTSFTGTINLGRVAAWDKTTNALPDGDYKVRVGYKPQGGDFTIASATLHVETSSGGTEVTIVWGDVNQNGTCDGGDATKILLGLAGGNKVCGDFELLKDIGNGIIWGDVNQNGTCDGGDATKILLGLAGGNKVCGDYELLKSETIFIPTAE